VDPKTGLVHMMAQYLTPRVWAHAVSKDFLRWTQLPVSLENDMWYDEGGVFSGSATVLNDAEQTPVLFYSVSTNDMLVSALGPDACVFNCVMFALRCVACELVCIPPSLCPSVPPPPPPPPPISRYPSLSCDCSAWRCLPTGLIRTWYRGRSTAATPWCL
jgi:hypothetical protein